MSQSSKIKNTSLAASRLRDLWTSNISGKPDACASSIFISRSRVKRGAQVQLVPLIQIWIVGVAEAGKRHNPSTYPEATSPPYWGCYPNHLSLDLALLPLHLENGMEMPYS